MEVLLSSVFCIGGIVQKWNIPVVKFQRTILIWYKFYGESIWLFLL